jgi:transposase
MFIRPCYRNKDGKRHAYWALVESYRTASGPRQRVVSYVGAIGDDEHISKPGSCQKEFAFGKERKIEIDPDNVQVRRCRDFGGVWLGWELIRRLGLDEYLRGLQESGKEDVDWALMAWVLVLSRLSDASSELYIAEHLYTKSAMPDLLGIPEDKINDDRLYRAMDKLLPHKDSLEVFLKNRLGELFDIKYDLLLYDVTSTYFEGKAEANTQAKRGYSRDHRSDCKQVCIALVVSRCGMPLGYKIFDGNTHDSKTVKDIVTKIEGSYGVADRIWVCDRGMMSEDNLEYLRQGNRKYIIGTPKSQLKAFEKELLASDWKTVRPGVEVKLCKNPENQNETFILCRSADRTKKEKAMHTLFAERIEEGLTKIDRACKNDRISAIKAARRVGQLMGQNARSAGLFDVDIKALPDGHASITWTKKEQWRKWAELSEGCYMLRSNISDWSSEDLWKAYIQLTEAETAFRIHKSDLRIRPIWHQKTERVQAHILVCFLAYVLWKTLGQLCSKAGLGDEPRRIFDELGTIRMVDVILPTTTGKTYTRRCVTRPTEHQAILLQKLGIDLPKQLHMTDCSEDF